MDGSNSAPALDIQYSKEFEKERVVYTIDKSDWFVEHGYRPTLPGGKQISDSAIKGSVTDLLTSVEEEYDENFFESLSISIINKWEWFRKHWVSSGIDKAGLTFSPLYEIKLTRYGVGGSYNQPSTVYLNVMNKSPEKCASVIFHEILHLAIETLIQKYHVSHWNKERIVDLYFEYFFPEMAFKGKMYEETNTVELLFKEYQSDVELFIQKVGKLG